MKFFSGLFGSKKSSPTQFKTISGINPNSFLAFALNGNAVNARDSFQFYQNSAAVATAVDMIADEVEQIQPVIRTRDGKYIYDHPILELLKKPNPTDDYRSFMGKMARYWLLSHDLYQYLEGLQTKLPVNIWPVSPQVVSLTESAVDGYASLIAVTMGPGSDSYKREEDFKTRSWRFIANELKEIYRTTGFSSETNNTRPDSPLQAAASDVSQQIKGKLHNVSVLENGGRLSMVAVFKDSLEKEEHDARKASIQAQLGGPGNAGKIAVISSSDMTIEEFGKTNRDMDYANLDRISALAIYMRYKIPLPLISNDAATYNNMEQAKYDLYDRAVLPAANIIFKSLTHALLPRAKMDPAKFEITYNPEAIPALRGRMLAELKSRRDLNLETINELRSQLPNREPLKEGGNAVYQPATLVPLGTDLYTEDNATELDKESRKRTKE